MTDTLAPRRPTGLLRPGRRPLDRAVLAARRDARTERPRAPPRVALGRGGARAAPLPAPRRRATPARSQRRALLLRNPGLTPPAFGATPTLVAAYQMLLPGESAPVHCPLVLGVALRRLGPRRPHGGRRRAGPHATRATCAHPGLVLARPRAHRRRRAGGVVRRARRAAASCRCAPASTGTRRRPAAPLAVRRLSGTEPTGARPRARRTAGRASLAPCAATRGTRPTRPCSACWPCPTTSTACSSTATRSPAGRRWRRSPARCGAWRPAAARRDDAGDGELGVVRRPGRGDARDRRPTVDVGTNDVVAVPAWTWHEIRAGDEELVLFRISDRPVHDAFGLYRSETATSWTSRRGAGSLAATT